jgi:hypothetical protein
MIAVCLEVTAAAVAVKAAVVAPAATETEAGTVRTDVLLLDRVTLVPPTGAALERVTVHVVVPVGGSVVPAHCIDVSVIVAAVTEIVTGMLDPFSAAVTIAV